MYGIYYGIKTPKKGSQDSYVWWIADTEYKSWDLFLSQPNRDGNYNSFRLPIAEAIEAYQAIGYKSVKLSVEEVEDFKLFKHYKTGGIYQVVCTGKDEKTLEPVTVYKNTETGEIWVRPSLEFNDRRFEPIVHD